jgi:uncharacterized protein (UPF0212 family)
MDTTPDADWYEITLSVPWIVHNVESPQDAINIAVAELGKRVAKTGGRIQNADIDVQSATCGSCGSEMTVATVVSGQALVGLLLTVDVRAPSAGEATRVAQREIGPHVPKTPLAPVSHAE